MHIRCKLARSIPARATLCISRKRNAICEFTFARAHCTDVCLTHARLYVYVCVYITRALPLICARVLQREREDKEMLRRARARVRCIEKRKRQKSGGKE